MTRYFHDQNGESDAILEKQPTIECNDSDDEVGVYFSIAYEKGERLNFATHAAASLAALIGATWLLHTSSHASKYVKFSVIVYAISLIAMFVGSAVYHGAEKEKKEVLRVLDYCLIYIFIAGTYTPFAVVALPPQKAVFILSGTWAIAALGICLELFSKTKSRWLSVSIYVVMGWCAIILVPYLSVVYITSFYFLVAGGIFYTTGIIFFAMDERWWLGHPTWHLFVMKGSAAHYFAIFALV